VQGRRLDFSASRRQWLRLPLAVLSSTGRVNARRFLALHLKSSLRGSDGNYFSIFIMFVPVLQPFASNPACAAAT